MKRSGKAARASAETAFLEAYDPSAFDRPSVAVDVVLLGIVDDALRVMLVSRAEPPFLGALALPGGFVKLDESLDAAAARVLERKAGLRDVFVEQLYTFGSPARDPRMRVISVAYYALVERAALERACTEHGAKLHVVPKNPRDAKLDLAFDHAHILAVALERIRGKLDYAPIGYELLPERFTLLDLQRVHECVAGRTLNKDSFRRRMLASGSLVATGEIEADVGHRPAALYRYVRECRD